MKCKCGRQMIKNKGNIDMWICPSHNEKTKTKFYNKPIKLYHGTKKKRVKSILKNGLLRGRKKGGWWGGRTDSVYIYTSPKIEIAKKFGDAILEIDGQGLDLRVWETDKENQIMIHGDIEPKRINLLK